MDIANELYSGPFCSQSVEAAFDVVDGIPEGTAWRIGGFRLISFRGLDGLMLLVDSFTRDDEKIFCNKNLMPDTRCEYLFLIKVAGRQNNTIQGVITCLRRGFKTEKHVFKSELELLRAMNGAIKRTALADEEKKIHYV